jgi:uncharacterized OB-fold protein
MDSDISSHALAVETASRLLEFENSARELADQHKEMWGDGPPYFSVSSAAFWREIANGHFNLIKCDHCRHVYFPPRVVCPGCWEQDVGSLYATEGIGVLKSFTDLHVTSPALKSLAPIRLAMIDLQEGVRVLTWLRGSGAERAQVGDTCRIVVEDLIGKKWFVANLA